MLDAGIRETLGARTNLAIDYFAEYLEAERFGANEASTALAGYISRKYQGMHIDVVIAITSQSLRFALEHRAALFADAPIVSVGRLAGSLVPAVRGTSPWATRSS